MTRKDDRDFARMTKRLHKVYDKRGMNFDPNEAEALMGELNQMEARLHPEDQDAAAWFRRDMKSPSGLLGAAEFGNAENVRVRLDAGAPINWKQDIGSGGTPLTEAAYRGHDSVVQLLVVRGADLNLADSQGQTALMKARSPTTTKILVTAGADVNAQDHDGNTALHHRAADRTGESLNLLLDHGANPCLVNRRGAYAEDAAQGPNKDLLVQAHVDYERGIFRRIAGLDANQDEPVQRHRKM